ncbi:MAG: hypothetical protein U9N01_04470 [Euryarchaeota archaeon]|nr:hypothetical protein [Euryarchaeota archaeon]
MKIALVALSHVSLDKLTTLGPKDESVRVRLESEQTKLPSGTDDVIDETNGDLGPFSLGERAAEKLKEAAERLSGEDEE